MLNLSALQEASLPLAQKLEKAIKHEAPKYSIPAIFLRIAAEDSRLRMRLLECIDILPSLTNAEELRDYLVLYLESINLDTSPYFFRLATRILYSRYGTLEARLMRYFIYHYFAPHFIVSKSKKLAKLEKHSRKHRGALILDFLGELVVSHQEADLVFQRYANAMKQHGNRSTPFHMAVKLSSLSPLFTPDNYGNGVDRVRQKLIELLEIAQETHSFITVDAEHYALRNMVEDVFCEAIMHRSLRDYPYVGIALQAYLIDAPTSAERFTKLAGERTTPFMIRLVKGAYWDTEVAYAQQCNWPCPVFGTKEATDTAFQDLLLYLMNHWGTLYPVCASHNPRSIAFTIRAAEAKKIVGHSAFGFQVLYGLGEPIRKVLIRLGFPVYVYVPVGDLTTGMAYFARRILENTSNEGFLLQLIQK